MRHLLLICFVLSLGLAHAQTQTKNYTQTSTYKVPVKTQAEINNLKSDEKIEQITYYDGLGRPEQQIVKQAGGQHQDVITPITYDALGRQNKTYLPYSNKNQSFGSASLNYVDNNSVVIPGLNPMYLNKFPEDAQNGSINPYSETHFEASPLNRVLEQGAPGKDWQVNKTSDNDHTIKFNYQTNTGTDEVIKYSVTHPNNNTELTNLYANTNNLFYANGTLIKTTTKDENWTPSSGNNHTTVEFKNTQGQVVLKRTFNANIPHDTYYVYDDYGNLTYVLPPKSVDLLGSSYNTNLPDNPIKNSQHSLSSGQNRTDIATQSITLSEGFTAAAGCTYTAKIDNAVGATLSDLCYTYHYDNRNRLIEKKLPGKDWEYIVYDTLDRPILTQDSHLRQQGQWLFTKYDAFNRVAYTGFIKGGSRLSLQGVANNQTQLNETRLLEGTNTPTALAKDPNTVLYYTNNVYPNGSLIEKVLTINYYDDYLWDTTNGTSEKIYGFETYTGATVYDDDGYIQKTASSTWGNSGFTTKGRIENDGYVSFSFRAPFRNKFAVGLTREDKTSQNDDKDTIDYGIVVDGAADSHDLKGAYTIIEGESEVYGPIPFDGANSFKVERIDKQIRYMMGNEVIYSSYQPSTGVLLGDGAIHTKDTELVEIHIGISSKGTAYIENAKGLVTGTKSRTLDLDNAQTKDQWITNAMYYDEKSRLILQTTKNDILDYKEGITNKLNFTGELVSSTKRHIGNYSKTPQEREYITQVDKFAYDHQGRLLRQTQEINDTPEELINKNNYDELGQLKQKQVGGRLTKYNNYTPLLGGITIESNGLVYKTGSNGWNAGFSTQNSIAGDGYASCLATQTKGAYTMFGLSYTDANQNYTSIDYAIYLEGLIEGPVVDVYEKGAHKNLDIPFDFGDTFAVERRGNTVYYLKNNEVFYISDIAATNQPMIADVSVRDNNTKPIKDLVLVDLEKELQEVDYTYNIRGWLTQINDIAQTTGNDLFKFKINYNKQQGSASTQFDNLYNGNISQTLWKTASPNPGGTNDLKTYGYQYDNLNRITKAIMRSGTDTNIGYHLDHVDYDKNGNIQHLQRKDASAIFDNLTYSYAGNQLLAVTDSGTPSATQNGAEFIDGNKTSRDYTYDSNGNLTADKNKNIASITYNHLNLPEKITFSTSASSIEYTYDATGTKQAKKVIEDTGSYMSISETYYAGGIIYEGDNTVPTIAMLMQSEGYIEPVSTGFRYTYQYKDHLDNIRLSYQDTNNDGNITPNNEILEENNYFPFGLKHKGYNEVVSANANSVASKFKYNDTELEEALGLNLYEMPFRQYDPAIARWTSIDPVTHHSQSTYNGYDNNPIFWADPSGADVEEIAGGTRYTGVDAQNMFRELQAQYGNNNENSEKSDTDPKNPFTKLLAEANKLVEDGEKYGYLNISTGSNQEITHGGRKCLFCIAHKNDESDLDANKSFLTSFGKSVSLLALNLSRFKDVTSLGAATQLRWSGRVAAAFSVGVDYSRYRSGTISRSEFAMNTTWTGIGVFGGKPGLIVSSLYWFASDVLGGKEMAQRNFEFRQRQRVEDPEAFREWVRTAKCFVSGTKILMSDLSEKNIENIKIGDKILGVDISKFKFEEDRVINITKFKSKKIIKMILANGEVIEFTEDHPFWVVGKGWAVFNEQKAKTKLAFEVNEIKEKDYILVYNEGKLIPLQIVELYDTKEFKDVYNLDNVEINNTFFANKALVHNRAN